MTPIPRVIDISHHNVIPNDFEETKKAGIIGVIHKCTEGATYVDPKVQARRYLAEQSGLLFGLYHFLRPGNMKAQADFFVNTAKALDVCDEKTLWVADHEDQGVSATQLNEFCDYVEYATGKPAVIYSGHVLKEQCAGQGWNIHRRVWVCQYCAPPPKLPEGCMKYWLWQYTDKGSIPGVNAPVDLNDIGDQSIEEFTKSWTGEGPVPVEEVVVYLKVEATGPPGVSVRVVVEQ
jgi:lysozyme